MDDQGPRVADYFVVTGLTENSKPLSEEIQSDGQQKTPKNLSPITDIAVIIRSQGEKVPPGFICIENTPFGFQADLNHGCLGSPSIFLCFKRGHDKAPITDIGVMYEGKERLLDGCHIVSTTPSGFPANVNNRIGVSNQRAYITYRRGSTTSHNGLAVVDIGVILSNKGEQPPHAFCLINKNLNKGSMVGNDVYLCYKKSAIRGNTLVFEAETLSRYPLEDDEEFPLPESVSKFCLPLGASIESWPISHTYPLPIFSTFVLTDQGGGKVYGAGVTFYEGYPEEKLNAQQRISLGLNADHKKPGTTHSIHTNKCICLLSHWPFFDAFKKFLMFIYRLSVSGPHTVPIERYIAHFMHEVPFPTPSRPRIFVQLGHSSLVLAQPQMSPMPLSGASYCALLQNLGPELCMNLLTYILQEQKILLHSLRPALLTAVAEAVTSMIFPFVWQCPYVPLCPLFLSNALNAPFPVIMGIDSRYFDMYDPPSDATCVDIDTCTVLLPDDRKTLSWKFLPKKPAKRLLHTLNNLYADVCKPGIADNLLDNCAVDIAPLDNDFSKKKRQLILELKIQDAFLVFMASLMKNYSHYLLPITQQPTQRVTDADARFNSAGFIKSRDKASHPFFKQFLKTQLFIKFIEEVSFVTENDERFAFFDDCTERIDVDSKEEISLIDYDSTHDSEHTVFVTPPDDVEEEGMEYSYNEFPVLKSELFLAPHLKGSSLSNRSLKNTFNSPFPRRTKQEMRQSHKIAKLQAASPEQWASFLLGQIYAIWFLHLPSYVRATHSKTRALKSAFEVLKKMQTSNIQMSDEVCYRILMQLCGQYSQPVLAVQVFMEMRQRGIKINAITYGYYNKAVMESRWPASSFSGYQQWVKLRNVLLAVAHLKHNLKRRSYSDTSDVMSRTSGESVDVRAEETELVKVMDANQACSLTREEKSSTGNSDMGYSSMIMDESNPIDLLGSPNISPIKSEDGIAELVDISENDHETAPSCESTPVKDESDPLPNGHDPNLLLLDTGPTSATSTPVSTTTTLINITDEENTTLTAPESKKNSASSNPGSRNSIVRRSRSSVGSTGSAHRGSSGIGLESMDGKTDESLMVENVFEPDPKQSRRRHRSEESPNWSLSLPMAINGTGNGHSSGKSSGNNSMSGSPASWRKDLFGSDAKIMESLEGQDMYQSNRTSPGVIRDLTETFERETLDPSKSDSVENQVTGMSNSKDSNFSVDLLGNHESSLLDPVIENEKNKQKVESTQKDSNLLISLDEDDTNDAVTKTNEKPEASLIKLESLNDQTNHSPRVFTNHKDSFDSLDSSDILADGSDDGLSLKKKLEKTESTNSSQIGFEKDTMSMGKDSICSDQTGSPQSTSPSASKESIPSALKRGKRTGSGFFSSILTTGLSPHVSKESISKKLFAAGSHMENIGSSMKSRTLDFAFKVGEYTKSFASPMPAQEKQSGTMSPATGSLVDLDTMSDQDLEEKNMELSQSLQDSKMDQDTLEELGIILPKIGMAGSCHSLNNVASSDGEDGARRLFAMEVNLSSCFQCKDCKCLIYDEGIISGWSSNDSNLQTSCCYCRAQLLPFLSINVTDTRDASQHSKMTQSPSSESVQSIQSAPFLKQADQSSRTTSGQLKNGSPSVPSIDNLSIDSDGDINTAVTKENKSSSDTKESEESGIDTIGPLVNFSGNDSSSHEDGQKSPSRRKRSSSETGAPDLRRTSEPGKGTENTTSFKPGTSMSLPRYMKAPDEADFHLSTSSLPLGVMGSRESLPAPKKDADIGPVQVPYLSPLVLRKELENVIENEGEGCLRCPSFVTQHPIIFWNLVWYFKRLHLPNYTSGALLAAFSELKDQDGSHLSAYSRYVKIATSWDNMTLWDEIGPPMYILWLSMGTQQNPYEHKGFSKAFMLQVVKCIRYDNVYIPITMLLDEYKRLGVQKGERRGIYYDILFLAFVSLGRENIDQEAFDTKYRSAFQRLPDEYKKLTQYDDGPLPSAVKMCIQTFGDLAL